MREYLPPWARMLVPIGRVDELPDLPVRLARVLEELGPTFVKLGQMLSTRPDLLPPEYLECLQRICHHAAPFSGDVARAIIEDELGGPVRMQNVVGKFSETPGEITSAGPKLGAHNRAVLVDQLGFTEDELKEGGLSLDE